MADAAAPCPKFGKPAWIALTVLGFALFWPLGLALLAFLLWSGRMGCWKHGRLSRWHEASVNRIHERMRHWQPGRPAWSGNRAFDEYREATEFDQFLAERRLPDAPQPQG